MGHLTLSGWTAGQDLAPANTETEKFLQLSPAEEME